VVVTANDFDVPEIRSAAASTSDSASVDRVQQFPTGLSQLQRAMSRRNRGVASLLLERLDLVADRRLGDEKFLRRAREAQVARCGAKARSRSSDKRGSRRFSIRDTLRGREGQAHRSVSSCPPRRLSALEHLRTAAARAVATHPSPCWKCGHGCLYSPHNSDARRPPWIDAACYWPPARPPRYRSTHCARSPFLRIRSRYFGAFPAGGPTDQVMRAFAEVAGRELKQSIVVENKPGGGGTIAPLALKTAKSDGYTLSQIPLGVFRIPHMQKRHSSIRSKTSPTSST